MYTGGTARVAFRCNLFFPVSSPRQSRAPLYSPGSRPPRRPRTVGSSLDRWTGRLIHVFNYAASFNRGPSEQSLYSWHPFRSRHKRRKLQTRDNLYSSAPLEAGYLALCGVRNPAAPQLPEFPLFRRGNEHENTLYYSSLPTLVPLHIRHIHFC